MSAVVSSPGIQPRGDIRTQNTAHALRVDDVTQGEGLKVKAKEASKTTLKAPTSKRRVVPKPLSKMKNTGRKSDLAIRGQQWWG